MMEFDRENNFPLILSSSNYAVYNFCLDKDDYTKYKQGNLKTITEERKIEMEILQLLENLGFPMNELGTYLYKNMVFKIVKQLKESSDKLELINLKDILLKLKNAFSQFYVDVAKHDLDMGIKTFHKHIENALEKIDYSKANPLILKRIYSKIHHDIDYGELAFILGMYIMGCLETEQSLNDIKPKIKKLSNMPDID